MKAIRTTRVVFAVLLLCSLFMPLSRCYYVKMPDTPGPAASANVQGQSDRHVDVYAVTEARTHGLRGAGILAAFVWPALFAAGTIVSRRFEQLVAPLEPLLCILSAIVIASLLDADEILPGGYLAMLGIAGYFTASLAGLYAFMRRRMPMKDVPQ